MQKPWDDAPFSGAGGPPLASGWLVPAGQMGRAIAGYPWEQTAWGALDGWPLHWRTLVNLMLESGAPTALILGTEFRFLYNDRYAEIIQDKHPTALGARGADIFPELWPVLRPLFERARSGNAVLVEDQELSLTRNGVTKPAYFSFAYNPVRRVSGEIDGFLAVVLETTARVARERERAHVFDTVLSAIADFAYTFDREGRFLYVNKALLDLWGLTLSQAVGKNFFELQYPADLASRLQRQIEQVFLEKRTIRDETRYVSPAGVEGYYEYIFSPVFGPNRTVVVVAGSTRDITVRKKLELEAVSASQAKDAFLATLSHELRTPLNPALLLATDGAQNQDWPAQARADFQTISDNINLEARLIDDLLDISRIAHDKLPLKFTVLDFHHVLTRAIALTSSEARAKDLVLTTEFEATPSIMTGDEVRLHQIFSNLLRNAVKFTMPGGRITVATRLHAVRRETAIIEVRDTGIGLTAAEIENVFQPFAQGEHALTSSATLGGLGLGLAIARKLAELHSGSIKAASAGRNQGATFTVELPLGAREMFSSATAPAVSSTVRPARPERQVRVLLVEDHDASRQALTRLLTARKIEVVHASSAEEAITMANAHLVDFVISDLGLPDMDGFELMKILKAKHGYQGIALSGYGTERDITSSKDAGFSLHLTKPVRAQALYEALDSFLATLG